MCGICGFLARGASPDPKTAKAMAGALAHRGPDGEGVHLDPPVALGHRRLSIIDLSEAASEPMTNEDGSLWLVFNGEIYNFRELRKSLEGRHRFRSQGDGEVILHLYEEQGRRAVVQELDGMFAFALWDAKRRRLLLARDRAGKKPLYYHDGPRVFAFASEVKALFAHPDVPRERDPGALPLFLTYGYVPTPGTFYRGIRSLPPAHRMVVTEAGAQPPVRLLEARFRSDALDMSDAEAEERFRRLLAARGGAPAGGGRAARRLPLRRARLGERGGAHGPGRGGPGQAPSRSASRSHSEYDETRRTRRWSPSTSAPSTPSSWSSPRRSTSIDRLVCHHDGPFGDSSAVPTYLLVRADAQPGDVALNGDGGDEVFAGYLRLYGGALSERMPRAGRSRRLARVLGLLPEPADRRHPLRFAKRFAEAGSLPLLERYLRWNAYFPSDLAPCSSPELARFVEPDRLSSTASRAGYGDGNGATLARLLQLNFETYLLDDLLVKMDRMSMAHGLEARSPFLDTAVVEFGAAPARPPAHAARARARSCCAARCAGCCRSRSWPAARWASARRSAPGSGATSRASCASACSTRRARFTSTSGPRPSRRCCTRHGTSDLSAQIWALLTLESWLRQEKAWGR